MTASVFPPFNRLKVCRYGQMLFNVNDRYIGRSLDLYGEYSEGEVALFRQIVWPGDVVVDVGAHVGAHTLFFARQVGPAGRVLAVRQIGMAWSATTGFITRVEAMRCTPGSTPSCSSWAPGPC